MKTETRNGKEYSDTCFNCGESKAAVEYYQRKKDPLYCAIVSNTESGMETEAEFDRHRFVRTLKQKAAEEQAELQMYADMDDMATFIMAEMDKETVAPNGATTLTRDI